MIAINASTLRILNTSSVLTMRSFGYLNDSNFGILGLWFLQNTTANIDPKSERPVSPIGQLSTS